jgi:hypothetical protein
MPASFRKTAPVDRLGGNIVDEHVSLASAWKMQTALLGVVVGNTKFKSDTDIVQAAYHPERKFSNAHSQGVVRGGATGITLFRVEISSYTQFFHSPHNGRDICNLGLKNRPKWEVARAYAFHAPQARIRARMCSSPV